MADPLLGWTAGRRAPTRANGEIRATVMDSNVYKSGTWEMRVAPGDGGSHIDVVKLE